MRALLRRAKEKTAVIKNLINLCGESSCACCDMMLNSSASVIYTYNLFKFVPMAVLVLFGTPQNRNTHSFLQWQPHLLNYTKNITFLCSRKYSVCEIYINTQKPISQHTVSCVISIKTYVHGALCTK
jgi:hypothetical protein